MKREIPPAAIVAVIVAGIAVIVGIWFASGGTGQLTSDERQLAEMQAKTRSEREAAAAGGGGDPASGSGVPDSEGLSGEAAARARHSSSESSGGQ